MSSGNIAAIVQHVTMIAARLQAVSAIVEKNDAHIEELKSGASSSTKPSDIAELKDELKKDFIRERAMMEAALEHRIDQQVNRSVVENDQTARISATNARVDDLEKNLVQMNERLSLSVVALETDLSAKIAAVTKNVFDLDKKMEDILGRLSLSAVP